MPGPTEPKLRLIFDVHQLTLSPAEEELLRERLEGLARQVENFPVADLHVLIEGNARSNDVSVKLTLILPGNTLVTSDHDVIPEPAFERALNSLLENLREYKDKLDKMPERQKAEKGTHHELHAPAALDAAALESAVKNRDYAAFRDATAGLEEGLSLRIGRWVQRYPEIDRRIGHNLRINDIVEEVFILAFDSYKHRPKDIAFGTWLENLIDSAICVIKTRGDEELENVRRLQSAREAVAPAGK